MISIKGKTEIILLCFSQTKLGYLMEISMTLRMENFDSHASMPKIAKKYLRTIVVPLVAQ
jgi:hypothetical protein